MANLIKPISNLEDFSTVFKIFEQFPYYEVWEPSEVKEEFNTLKENGYLFGYYLNNKCIGIVSARKPAPSEHPETISNKENSILICDLAVLPEFRHNGIGTDLIQYILNILKEDGFKFVYFRYSDSNPMILSIAKKFGFTKQYDVCQVILHPRHPNTRIRSNEDLRFFMGKVL